MSTTSNTFTLGPALARLTVRTGKSGAAAMAGHNLLIEVGDWQATLQTGATGKLERVNLRADPGSLRVLEGSGGMQALGEEDRANIQQTIAEEVLDGGAIEFRSAEVSVRDGGYRVEGDLELNGRREPLAFDIEMGEERHAGARVTIKQSDWGMKPYSTLFGTLKVNDEVVVEFEGGLPGA